MSAREIFKKYRFFASALILCVVFMQISQHGNAYAGNNYSCHVTGGAMKWPGRLDVVDPTKVDSKIIGSPEGGGSILGQTFQVYGNTGVVVGVNQFSNVNTKQDIKIIYDGVVGNFRFLKVLSVDNNLKYVTHLDLQEMEGRSITFSHYNSSNGLFLIGECVVNK